MSDDPRYFRPYSLLEVTDVTVQNRYLLRPSAALNDRFLGVLGRAQRQHDMPACGLTVLSSHYHLLVEPRDPDHLASFMNFVGTNLGKEVNRLHGWSGSLWRARYRHVVVSWEEAAQVARLKYLLGNSVKELLVDRPSEWPGVNSVAALIEGKPLVGHWYNRTKEYAARQLRREEDVDEERFATEEQLVLSPLPCWAHLPEEEWRGRVQDLVAQIEEEGARERRRTGKKSLGVKKILRVRPHKRPRKVKRSPKPRFHAVKPEVFKRMREAWKEVMAAFRNASARLRAGEMDVEFPEGTFPPGLPFIPFAETMTVEARGQPA